jgi:pyruvate ferredoxin oxidoreductase alpha subunit
MNADRSTALPWNIYGDQRDSLSQLDSGWIQAYAENAQEALDLALMSYKIAENKAVSTPYMANLDGFVLTHTYETVEIPDREQADRFLPPYETDNRIDFDNPKNMAFSAGPDTNYIFKYREHEGVLAAKAVITETEKEFAEIFGRKYTGLTESYLTEDADYILITLGSIAGLCRETADKLRSRGVKAGVLRIRYMRPFPNEEIARELKNAKGYGVLEKDISFGNEGTVYTNVNSALKKAGLTIKGGNFIGGLGGRNISAADIEGIFADIADGKDGVHFLGIGGSDNG